MPPPSDPRPAVTLTGHVSPPSATLNRAIPFVIRLSPCYASLSRFSSPCSLFLSCLCIPDRDFHLCNMVPPPPNPPKDTALLPIPILQITHFIRDNPHALFPGHLPQYPTMSMSRVFVACLKHTFEVYYSGGSQSLSANLSRPAGTREPPV